MDDETTVNLTASLRCTVTNLYGVANSLPDPSTDEEIEQQAKALECIAEDVSQGAAILRALIMRRKRAHGLLPRRIPSHAPNVPRVPPGIGGGQL
jgi:hypothetical protein